MKIDILNCFNSLIIEFSWIETNHFIYRMQLEQDESCKSLYSLKQDPLNFAIDMNCDFDFDEVEFDEFCLFSSISESEQVEAPETSNPMNRNLPEENHPKENAQVIEPTKEDVQKSFSYAKKQLQKSENEENCGNDTHTKSKEFLKSNKKINHYEKNRMQKVLHKLSNFDITATEPYHWMMSQFGCLIKHKKFNMIFSTLKDLLPKKYRPSRDVNRNEVVRIKWLCDIWHVYEVRVLVQDIILNVIDV
ncbi:hypothetical protein TRFO_40740 [Tritrichomonas foetus]|uniref:Uncharacterized protein n=1 Tax=Tritrichomonas foetus TaxID=1144522 RepID=A0A1J4J460_9EUKA|nr:hypothetical protein TRFO_40740 [Tritrichomonas foetus]|eukprot:OHS92927.1 hypothetical protein TRFO_40740 [Tritrichomonas foetus]